MIAPPDTSPPGAPPRLLIVDDEVRQMTALCQTLIEKGYQPVGFSAPLEALEALRHQRFDLVLTDLMMPGMDGITLIRSALEIDGDLVGIVMTGQGTIDSAVEAMKSGAVDYILKPFKLSFILPVLARALTLRQLRRDNRLLQQRVAERTAQLESANQDLEAFSYSVAHDLRGPVRSIVGFSSMVLEDFGETSPPEMRRRLEMIAGGARRMGLLIEGLLKLAHLGRQPITRAPVRLGDLVSEIVADLQRDRNGHPAEVTIGPLPEISADPVLLRQVLVNLLSNAFKFTRQRTPPRIEVDRTTIGDEEVFYIRDNGAGFDSARATKLFGVFQRMHGVEEFEGTGIGLSIVQRIIRRHGGRVWAESVPDQGATFFFTLPAGVE